MCKYHRYIDEYNEYYQIPITKHTVDKEKGSANSTKKGKEERRTKVASLKWIRFGFSIEFLVSFSSLDSNTLTFYLDLLSYFRNYKHRCPVLFKTSIT